MRRAIEVRDEFLLIASHELKTPPTSLLLQLQRLERILEADDRLGEKSSNRRGSLQAARQID